ncbi:hypothetical protein Tco_0594691 [Tanacetum coccineum]
MPHDSPLPGGHTPGSDEGSMTLHELMIQLLNKVKKLEQTVKTSQTRRRAKIVVSDDEESLEDTSKQGRMIEDIDQDTRISLVTPTKVSSQDDQSKDQLGVLCAGKVLADASKKNVNTYTRRRRAVSNGIERVSTASRIFSTAEESVSTAGASMPVSTVALMQESEKPKKIKKSVQIQMSLDEELAQKLHEEEQARFNIQANEDLAQKLLEEERENLSIKEKARLLAELIDKRKKLQATQFYEVKEMFDNVYKQVTSFVPMDSVMEKERTKRAGLNLQEESSKGQKTREGSEPTEELKADEISQEDLHQIIMVVPVEEVYVEALQVKYPIIDWEVYFEATRKYWKIIRVGNHTEAYQTFDDMLKKFDKYDLDKLWSLVK